MLKMDKIFFQNAILLYVPQKKWCMYEIFHRGKKTGNQHNGRGKTNELLFCVQVVEYYETVKSNPIRLHVQK